jgi:hypothetical protein
LDGDAVGDRHDEPRDVGGIASEMSLNPRPLKAPPQRGLAGLAARDRTLASRFGVRAAG